MPTLTRSGLLNLKVEAITHETPDSISLLLKDIDGKEFDFKAGQFLTFVFDEEGKEVRRCYSIYTSPKQLPHIGIAIKKVPGGFISENKMDDIKEGDILPALVPMGNFIRKQESKPNLLMFGAGSGITPLLALIEDSLADEKVNNIVLHYVNRDQDNIMFGARLSFLENLYPGKIKVIHHLTKPFEGWRGQTGRIDKESARVILGEIPLKEIADTEIFMCGPAEMMENIYNAAIDSGFLNKDIHREVFTHSIKNESRLPNDRIARRVSIILGGRTYDLIVDPNDSILDTALDAGIDVPHSCRYGSCSSCVTKLVSGKIVMLDQTTLSDEDIARGLCLTCVGYPESDDLILNYDDPLI